MRRLRTDDSGFTLIEVIVAMVIFAIIMTGFIYVTMSSFTMTRDTRARIVAANLAAEQVDAARAAGNAFDVVNSKHSATVNGDKYTVATKTRWINSAGNAATCNASGNATLSYKSITVEVTWDNMTSRPVRSDTALTPASKINDPTRGTILVGVLDASGAGVQGVSISLSPANGVTSVKTDSDGCAYLLQVPAGSYTLSVSKAGYVTNEQVADPSTAVTVAAGRTSQVGFAYDRPTTITATYATNFAGPVSLPTNLPTTFSSSYGNEKPAAVKSAGNTKTFSLFPVPSGYSLIAGDFAEASTNVTASCLAPNPGRWIDSDTKVGRDPDPVAGLAGTSITAAVPMGVVQVTGAGTTNSYVKAQYVGGGDGDPGCGYTPGTEYTFGNVLGAGSANLALPYGTWKLFRGNASGQSAQITAGLSVATGGTANAGVVTLDPRVAP